MPLTEDEVKALRSIIQEELATFQVEVNRRFDEAAAFRDEVNSRFEEVNGRFDRVNRRFDAVANQLATLLRRHELFRGDVNRRFDEAATYIDGLYKHDETREQEYLFIKEQIRRLEAKSA